VATKKNLLPHTLSIQKIPNKNSESWKIIIRNKITDFYCQQSDFLNEILKRYLFFHLLFHFVRIISLEKLSFNFIEILKIQQ
jgi:hypothetical protein